MTKNNEKEISVLEQQVQQVEGASRALDTTKEEFKGFVEKMGVFTSKFLGELPHQLANNPNPDVVKLIEPIPDKPISFDSILAQLGNEVLMSGLNAASGRYMAYVPGGGVPSAALGDYLAALTNRYSGNYGACPAAAEIENTCVR